MMKSAFLWVLLYLATGVVAQPVTDPGFDDVLSNKLQWALVTSGATGSHKNLSAAVYIPGQGTWTGTYNPGSLPPITTDSKFCIASNSKSFIAGLCLKLAEEGLLDLDVPISTYLETAYPNVNPNITTRQLLSHQSGLFDFIMMPLLLPLPFTIITWIHSGVGKRIVHHRCPGIFAGTIL